MTTGDGNIFGYRVGKQAQDAVPVLTGPGLGSEPVGPTAVQLKQSGVAAASSGDVEVYHIPGVRPRRGGRGAPASSPVTRYRAGESTAS
ncbi:putative aconitase [Streptomyces sp. V3I8]|nr:putative aconitase [Streptomyces sp. V3I8]